MRLQIFIEHVLFANPKCQADLELKVEPSALKIPSHSTLNAFKLWQDETTSLANLHETRDNPSKALNPQPSKQSF